MIALRCWCPQAKSQRKFQFAPLGFDLEPCIFFRLYGDVLMHIYRPYRVYPAYILILCWRNPKWKNRTVTRIHWLSLSSAFLVALFSEALAHVCCHHNICTVFLTASRRRPPMTDGLIESIEMVFSSLGLLEAVVFFWGPNTKATGKG